LHVLIVCFSTENLFAAPSLSVDASITPLNGPFTAGQTYILTCTANVTERGSLNITTHIMWTYHSKKVTSGTGNLLNFTINPLQVSDAGQYTCMVNVSSPLLARSQNFSNSITINVTGMSVGCFQMCSTHH